MKTQSQILFNKLTNVFFTGIGAQIQEALLKDPSNNQRRVFSSADLWNIQRRRKSIVVR